MKPTVLIDCDGPMTDSFYDVLCVYLRNEGITWAYPHLIDDWDPFKTFGVNEHIRSNVTQKMRLPWVAKTFHPRQNVVEFLADLRTWAEVVCVTAPMKGSATWAGERHEWLEELGFKTEDIHSTHGKFRVFGHAFIDDKKEHLDGWQAQHPGGLAIMWSEPHNRNSKWDGLKTNSFGQLLEWLQSIRTQQ